MLRRRVLAAITLAGLALPVRAQERPECTGRGTYSVAQTEFASQVMVDQGSPPVRGLAFDVWERRWSNPDLTIRWLAKAVVPSGALTIEIGASPPITPVTLTLFRGEDRLLTLRGADMESYDPYSESDAYVIDLGDGQRTDRGQITAAQTLIDGDPLRISLQLDTGRTINGTLQFSELGLRRAQAQQMSREDLARYRSGACKLRIGSCYLTTAAVDAVGLADDCWELRTLRAFRDGPLQSTLEGQALVADYYRLAPDLVARISVREDARRQWLHTYVLGIVPSAIAARLGLNNIALSIYARMTRRLQALAN